MHVYSIYNIKPIISSYHSVFTDNSCLRFRSRTVYITALETINFIQLHTHFGLFASSYNFYINKMNNQAQAFYLQCF